jgi:FlaA1/EpsC-like NDP-sugar epimerase
MRMAGTDSSARWTGIRNDGVGSGAAGKLARSLPVKATRLRAGFVYAAQDIVVVAGCFATVLLLRYGGHVPANDWAAYLAFVPLAALIFVTLHMSLGLYGRIWRYASINEARRLLLAGGLATLVLYAVDEVAGRPLPRAVVLAGSVFTTMLVGTTRFQSRLFAFRRSVETPTGLGVIVLGAGDTGATLARQMQEAKNRQTTPVAFLDDLRALQGRTVHGVPVVGDFASLPGVARETGAQIALLAVPAARRDLVRRVAELSEEAGVALRVLPPDGPTHVVGAPSLNSVRDVGIEDLLGREQVRTDLARVSALVRGRRVLVTGGGGSIGSEIVRQVFALGPASLTILDHDETHLHDTLATLSATEGQTPDVELADIRDSGRMLQVFRSHRPEVVFHAAAHKHVPVLEDHPCEAVLTNVVGTQAVVDAAAAVGTEALVLISTDKAVRPSSVMGASKRIAEMIVTQNAQETGRRWCAVRFGNVLASRGSVVPTFLRQIESGGPITVTHAAMTRYFMSIPEAVQLVLQAAATSHGADLFMLDMGQPIRIMDLAKRMVHLSGRRLGEDVELRIVGVRPGEKLHEQLSTPEESSEPTEHAAVVRLHPLLPLEDELRSAVAAMSTAARSFDSRACRRALASLAGLGEVSDLPSSGMVVPHQESAWTPSTT